MSKLNVLLLLLPFIVSCDMPNRQNGGPGIDCYYDPSIYLLVGERPANTGEANVTQVAHCARGNVAKIDNLTKETGPVVIQVTCMCPDSSGK